MPYPVQLNEATAAHRRMYFYLVDATDGLTPETGEAAGQPQISTNGGAYTNTGIGTLTHQGNGQYYADLTQAACNGTVGDRITGRYKSANTAEAPSLEAFLIVNYDPHENIAASVTGAVGSVTGAVGSVTGNVGGNVTGSVGSVTGNVGGNVTGSVGSVATDGVDSDSLAATALAAITEDVWTELLNQAKYATNHMAGKHLRTAAATLVAHDGTAQAGAAGQITLAAAASAVDDYYSHSMIVITGGTGEGQVRLVYGYTGSSKVAKTVPAWDTTPDNTSDYAIMPALAHTECGVGVLRTGYAQAGSSTTITLDAGASATDDFYNGAIVQIHHDSSAEGQSRRITDYNGTTKVVTVDSAWKGANPSSGAQFAITSGIMTTTTQGAYTITLHTQETDATAVPTVKLTVMDSNDAVVITTATTDTSGDVDVNLDAGDYEIRPFKANYSGATQSITVSEDATENITIDALSTPASADPQKCTASGKIVDITGAAVEGAKVIFTTRGKLPQATDNTDAYVSDSQANTTTDEDGEFAVELARLATVYINIPAAGITVSFQVPDAASVTLGTIMA